MNVSNPRIIPDADGVPILHIDVAGRPAELFWDQKPTLTEAGITFLGGEFKDLVPPIRFEVPGEPGNVHILRGCTDDSEVARLFRRYLEFCNDPHRPDPVDFRFD